MPSLKEGYVVVGPWWKSQFVSLSPGGRLLFYAEGNKGIEMDLNLQEWSFAPSELAPFTLSFRLHTSPSSSSPSVSSPSFVSSGNAPLSARGEVLPPLPPPHCLHWVQCFALFHFLSAHPHNLYSVSKFPRDGGLEQVVGSF